MVCPDCVTAFDEGLAVGREYEQPLINHLREQVAILKEGRIPELEDTIDELRRQRALLVDAVKNAIEWASDPSDCSYFAGTGVCGSGCATEPHCLPDRPREGWPKERLRSVLRDIEGAMRDE